MELPSIDTYGRGTHGTLIDCGPLRIWFSYRTPIAFMVQCGEIVVRENDWGTTTGAHMAAIDGGDKQAKAARIPGKLFEQRLSEACSALSGQAVSP